MPRSPLPAASASAAAHPEVGRAERTGIVALSRTRAPAPGDWRTAHKKTTTHLQEGRRASTLAAGALRGPMLMKSVQNPEEIFRNAVLQNGYNPPEGCYPPAPYRRGGRGSATAPRQ